MNPPRKFFFKFGNHCASIKISYEFKFFFSANSPVKEVSFGSNFKNQLVGERLFDVIRQSALSYYQSVVFYPF